MRVIYYFILMMTDTENFPLVHVIPLFLVASLFVLLIYFTRKINTEYENIYDDVQIFEQARNLRKHMAGLDISIITSDELSRQADIIDSHIESGLVDTPSNTPLERVVVHFYHRPRDVEEPQIMQTNIALLNKNYYILWLYSKNEAADFESQLINNITARAKADVDILPQCQFLPMTRSERLTPINFTVVAPHLSDVTVTFIRLPGDNNFHFGMRIRETGPLAGKFDRFALTCLARLPDRVDHPTWRAIREEARQRVRSIGRR